MQNNIQQHYTELRQAEADAEYWLKQYEAQLREEHEKKIKEIEEEFKQREEALKQQFSENAAGASQRVKGAMARLKYAAATWTMDAWQGYPEETPTNAMMNSLRAGILRRDFPASGITEVPVMLPMLAEGHVLVISEGTTKARARSLLQSLALRAVLMFANDHTEFIFIDPFGMGANFPFQDLPTSIHGETVYVEEGEINTQVRRLTDHIRSGGKDKSYILCAADFPRRFSEDALQRLIPIAAQGVAKGIYLLLHVDSDVPLPAGFDTSDLLESSSVVFMTPEGSKTRIGDVEYAFAPDNPPEKTLLNALLKKVAGR